MSISTERVAGFIKEIGRGARGARGLPRAEATELATALLAGDIQPAQVGAILLALRMKGETVDEVAGFHLAAATHCARIKLPHDSGTTVVIPSYNGARRNSNLIPLLALLLRELGLSALVHGLTEVTGRVTTAAIWRTLELPFASSVAAATEQLARERLTYIPLTELAPALGRLLAWRTTLGVRNVGHTIVKLINPVSAPALLLVPMTHPPYLQLLREYFAERDDSVLLFRGSEGEAISSPMRVPDFDWFSAGRQQVLHGVDISSGEERGRSAIDAISTAQHIRTLLSQPERMPSSVLETAKRILVATRRTASLDEAQGMVEHCCAQSIAA